MPPFLNWSGQIIGNQPRRSLVNLVESIEPLPIPKYKYGEIANNMLIGHSFQAYCEVPLWV